MALKTKVQRFGDSLGIILPPEALDILKAKEGDSINLDQASPESLSLQKSDEHFERIMQIAEECMVRYQNALRELAK